MSHRLLRGVAVLIFINLSSSVGAQNADVRPISKVLEFAPTKFLSKNVIEEISKLSAETSQVTKSANEVLETIRQKCGWPDPAILYQFAKRNNITRIDESTLERLKGTTLYYPPCVRLSFSGALVNGAADGTLSDFATTDEVKGFFESEEGGKVTAALKTASEQNSARGGEIPASVTDLSGPTRSGSMTGPEIDLANEILANRIPPDQVDVSRGLLFSNAIYDLALDVKADLTAAISTVKEGDKARVTTIPLAMNTPQTANQAQEVVAVVAATGQVKVSSPVPALIAPILSDKDADQDCKDGHVDHVHIVADLKRFFDAIPRDQLTALVADGRIMTVIAGLLQQGVAVDANNTSQWPLNTAKLLDVLLLNAYERERRGRTQGLTRVLIADTGFPLMEFASNTSSTLSDRIEPQQFFSMQDFFVNEDEKGQDPDTAEDLDQDGFKNNVFGISLQKLNGDIAPAGTYQFRDHGMSVASLAIGGVQLNRYRMLRTLPIRLHFANLTDETDPSHVQLTNRELSLLVRYARDHKIDIINMSISSDQPMLDLESAIKKSDDTLFVVAAGNDGKPLHNANRWPANFGGNDNIEGGIVITVAAHREDGRILKFSNYSPTYVDVAAPGCEMSVPIFAEEAGNTKLRIARQHGTSFAAPIVSFIAALLGAEGLHAHDIKRRIVISSDHDDKIANKVHFGARLDPAAALSIYDDIIDLRGENGKIERIRGRLNRNQEIELCSGPRAIKNLYRINMVSRDGSRSTYQEFQAVKRGSKYTYEAYPPCGIDDANAPMLDFYDIDAFEGKKIALSQIKTVLMRER